MDRHEVNTLTSRNEKAECAAIVLKNTSSPRGARPTRTVRTLRSARPAVPTRSSTAPRATSTRTKKKTAPDASWTFLSNHFHVLVLLAREADLSLRAVALAVGITERSAQRIVADLEQGGYLHKERVGRSNHYRMIRKRKLRHPLEAHCALDELVEIMNRGAPRRTR